MVHSLETVTTGDEGERLALQKKEGNRTVCRPLVDPGAALKTKKCISEHCSKLLEALHASHRAVLGPDFNTTRELAKNKEIQSHLMKLIDERVTKRTTRLRPHARLAAAGGG